MQTSFSEIKSKKGDKVYLAGSWNGYNGDILQFYLTFWEILACGKIQTYLTSNAGNSKKTYYSNSLMYLIDGKKDLNEAIEEAKNDCFIMVKKELERMEEDINFYISNGYSNEDKFIIDRKERLNKLASAPMELIVFSNWYTTGKSEISQTIKL